MGNYVASNGHRHLIILIGAVFCLLDTGGKVNLWVNVKGIKC